MEREIGSRVGAILCANDKEIVLLGYGVYEGRKVVPEAPAATDEIIDKLTGIIDELNARTVESVVDEQIGIAKGLGLDDAELAEMRSRLIEKEAEERKRPSRERALEVFQSGHKNPCIKLDNGDIVWGRECWWGPEEEIKAQVAKYVQHGRTVRETTIAFEREAHKAAVQFAELQKGVEASIRDQGAKMAEEAGDGAVQSN